MPGTTYRSARRRMTLAAAAILGATVALASLPANSAESESAIARGGRLYDKWFAENKAAKPGDDHPAYPHKGGRYGKDTSWRCKECHGWDYKGADGAYGKGSHATGIKGVTAMAGAEPAKIAELLRAEPHGFTAAMIPDEALARLALFISKGQHDTDAHIDRASKKAKGDADRGRMLFQGICAACHGFDGKSLNFGDDKEPEFLGTVAADNPWEALHKIRNGQPAVPMPLMRVLDMQTALDILAYSQTLPVK